MGYRIVTCRSMILVNFFFKAILFCGFPWKDYDHSVANAKLNLFSSCDPACDRGISDRQTTEPWFLSQVQLWPWPVHLISPQFSLPGFRAWSSSIGAGNGAWSEHGAAIVSLPPNGQWENFRIFFKECKHYWSSKTSFSISLFCKIYILSSKF